MKVKHTLHREEQGRCASSPTVGLSQFKEDFLHPPAGSAGQGLRSFPLFINIQELRTVGIGCLCFDVCPAFCLHLFSDSWLLSSAVDEEDLLSTFSKGVRWSQESWVLAHFAVDVFSGCSRLAADRLPVLHGLSFLFNGWYLFLDVVLSKLQLKMEDSHTRLLKPTLQTLKRPHLSMLKSSFQAKLKVFWNWL